MSEPQPPRSDAEAGGHQSGPYPPVQSGYEGVQPTERGRRIPRWLLGILGLLLLLCVSLLAAAALFGPRIVRGTTEAMRGANSTVTGYYQSVGSHDWERAHGYLSSQLRSSTKPSDIQDAWQRREAAYGAVDRFKVTGTQVRTTAGIGTTAVVSGTLHYRTGQSEPKIVNLVKEGDDWRLASLP